MPFVDPDRIEQSDRVQAASFAPTLDLHLRYQLLLVEHDAEEDAEESHCQYTTLLHAATDGNRLRQVTTECDLSELIFVQLDHHPKKIEGQPSRFRTSLSPVLLTENKASMRLTIVASQMKCHCFHPIISYSYCRQYHQSTL